MERRRSELAEVGDVSVVGIGMRSHVGIASKMFKTLAEEGIKGFAAANWWGIMFPAGVSKPIIDKVSADLGRALADAEVKKNLGIMAIEAVYTPPEKFAAFIQSERKLWGDLIRDAKITGNQ